MHISRVRLKSFRNFKDAIINLTEKSLIIGCNEIGKSNLLYALRILLDRNLSEANIEPQDSDFYVYEDTNEIEIVIEFEGASEDCVLSRLRQHISDDGTTCVVYQACRDPNTKRKSYRFLVGRDPQNLTEVDSRFYLRVLNLKFMGSKRDLFAFIRRERGRLIEDAKRGRQEEEIERDNTILRQVEARLGEVEEDVAALSYIGKATESLNRELALLSFQNVAQNVIFDTGASDPSRFVDNLRLAAQVGEKTLAVGGDGRNNQIQLALWTARNRGAASSDEDPLEVNIFCIEEPEAHLHPHQQRKLATYLAESLKAQVIITTHSPQIVCAFPPASIVRLYNNAPDTLAAGNGSNPFIERTFIDFGHRLSILPAEAFFSSVVLLVEGRSEELFYRALAQQIGVDLDRLNVSILMVDGIGFEPYVSLLHSLGIDYVIRTDNDVFRVPRQQIHRFAGIQRGIAIYRLYYEEDDEFEQLLERADMLSGFSSRHPPKENLEYACRIVQKLEEFDIYIADVDLEHDLHNALGQVTAAFFGLSQDDEIIREMQKRKATFMFSFLHQHSDSLCRLGAHSLAKPLLRCQEIAQAQYGCPETYG